MEFVTAVRRYRTSDVGPCSFVQDYCKLSLQQECQVRWNPDFSMEMVVSADLTSRRGLPFWLSQGSFSYLVRPLFPTTAVPLWQSAQVMGTGR